MTPQEAARDAAVFGDALVRHLLGASSTFNEPAEQLACMEQVFAVWPLLCARMSVLEVMAPNCRERGYAQAERLREMADRVEMRKAEAA